MFVTLLVKLTVALAIHRSFVSRDVTRLIRAYKTYVRPLVESNTVIWSPTAIGDVDLLERVQRKFTKKLPGMQNLPYTERLKLLNLDSLELRRLRVDLIWCYKIIFGLTCLNVNDFFCAQHAFKLLMTLSTGTRACFFL